MVNRDTYACSFSLICFFRLRLSRASSLSSELLLNDLSLSLLFFGGVRSRDLLLDSEDSLELLLSEEPEYDVDRRRRLCLGDLLRRDGLLSLRERGRDPDRDLRRRFSRSTSFLLSAPESRFFSSFSFSLSFFASLSLVSLSDSSPSSASVTSCGWSESIQARIFSRTSSSFSNRPHQLAAHPLSTGAQVFQSPSYAVSPMTAVLLGLWVLP